jgi:4,5-DOPA dioxygenase extradiol
MAAFDKMNVPNYGFDWAVEINEKFKKNILDNDHKPLINYESLGSSAKLAIPTPDHYYPLLYILGMQEKNEQATIFNDVAVAGALTMTSVRIG